MQTYRRGSHQYERKADRWQWRFIHLCEWIADVHLFVYPLLVVAFFWWLAYGHR